MNYKQIIHSNPKNQELYLKNESFPPAVILDTTNYCNLKCTCCGHAKMTREKGFMALSLYKKVVQEVAKENVETDVWMVYYGEPLILKYKLVYLIDYAKKQGLKNVFLNTNGVLLNNELSEALIESGIDKIVISLDAFYEDTYIKIRNNNNFNKVKDNIKELISLRKSINPELKLEVQLIELPEVHQKGEVELFEEYWKEQGIETKIKPYVTWTGAIDINEMRHNYRYPCSWLFRTFVVMWNGDVPQCGCDFDKKYIAGNVNENSIKTIWTTKLKQIRDLHLEGKYDETPICSHCKDWDSYIIMPFLEDEK